MNRRMSVLMSVLGGLLALVAVGGYQYMASQRDAALAAEEDMLKCGQLAARIKQFGASSRPFTVAAQERHAEEIIGQVEEAAVFAGIAPDSLTKIAPEPSVQVGQTVYKETPTHIYLQKVTLKQLVGLLHRLLTAEIGLNVKSVHLSAPREDTTDRWTVDLVLTYLIYSPPRSEK